MCVTFVAYAVAIERRHLHDVVQVSPPNAPAFIARAPPSVPGMPAKNSAGQAPLDRCFATSRMRSGTAPHLVVVHALELAEHSMRIDDRAANAAIAHEQVTAEPNPHDGRRCVQAREKRA
jgi:hypothetical protein